MAHMHASCAVVLASRCIGSQACFRELVNVEFMYIGLSNARGS
jgi:hypothetical protein